MTTKTSMLALVCCIFALPAAAQPQGLSERDTKNLASLLRTWRQFPAYPRNNQEERQKDNAQKSFFDAVKKLQEAGNGDILKHIDAWRAIFAEDRVANLERTPSGRGMVREGSVRRSIRGKEFAFDYAIYLPSNYSSAERWPLIVALHDEGSDGRRYLNEVWMNRDIPRDVRDQFIILAPTIGERTAGRPSEQVRISWFDDLHRRGLAMCLIEVLSRFHVDMDRVYAEGAGLGGTTAIELKKMWPTWFVAAASRNGLPAGGPDVNRDPAFVNIRGQGAILFATREGELWSSDQGKARRQVLERYRDGESVDIRFKDDYPALIPSQMTRARGSQKVDPVHDATADIAAFLKEFSRVRTPLELTYLTYDNRSFSESSWLRMEIAAANPKDKSLAEIRASVDKGTNTLKFATTNVESFRIHFNDELVDLDKPVAIVVNGREVLKQEVTRSLDYLLELNAANGHDPDKISVATLLVSVPAPEEGKEEGK